MRAIEQFRKTTDSTDLLNLSNPDAFARFSDEFNKFLCRLRQIWIQNTIECVKLAIGINFLAFHNISNHFENISPRKKNLSWLSNCTTYDNWSLF